MTKRDHMQRAKAFLADARKAIADAQSAIDAAGEHGDQAIGGDSCDMLACFASNTLHGALSLLRELEATIKRRRP